MFIMVVGMLTCAIMQSIVSHLSHMYWKIETMFKLYSSKAFDLLYLYHSENQITKTGKKLYDQKSTKKYTNILSVSFACFCNVLFIILPSV